ncbi:hypothetical protein PMIN03_009370 [Paraphaeosphaeria minitans]
MMFSDRRQSSAAGGGREREENTAPTVCEYFFASSPQDGGRGLSLSITRAVSVIHACRLHLSPPSFTRAGCISHLPPSRVPSPRSRLPLAPAPPPLTRAVFISHADCWPHADCRAALPPTASPRLPLPDCCTRARAHQHAAPQIGLPRPHEPASYIIARRSPSCPAQPRRPPERVARRLSSPVDAAATFHDVETTCTSPLLAPSILTATVFSHYQSTHTQHTLPNLITLASRRRRLFAVLRVLQ